MEFVSQVIASFLSIPSFSKWTS